MEIDVKKLLEVLQCIVDNGDTVLVIEHNLDIIKCADYIIDLGPEGGDEGGNIMAVGTPEQICEVSESSLCLSAGKRGCALSQLNIA